MRVFFPSCKTKMAYPESSERLLEYLRGADAIDKVAGCCQKDRGDLVGDDTAILICNTCMAFVEETSEAKDMVSVWELIDSDADFEFPDYQGKEITVQDCWRANGRHEVHDAIRSLLTKMNLRPVELEDNKDESRFCGIMAHMPLADYYVENAPMRFGDKAKRDSLFSGKSQDESIALVREHASKITTKEAISYCVGCDPYGLALSEIASQGMLDLLFKK